jgi:hypothetical protein
MNAFIDAALFSPLLGCATASLRGAAERASRSWAYCHGDCTGSREKITLRERLIAKAGDGCDARALATLISRALGRTASERRTGHFRLGGNELLVDASGGSHISLEDFAVAMIDELVKAFNTQFAQRMGSGER